MTFSFRGPATYGVQTDMERHYQWAVVHIHYSSIVFKAIRRPKAPDPLFTF
jgi:hypothetical protein